MLDFSLKLFRNNYNKNKFDSGTNKIDLESSGHVYIITYMRSVLYMYESDLILHFVTRNAQNTVVLEFKFCSKSSYLVV